MSHHSLRSSGQNFASVCVKLPNGRLLGNWPETGFEEMRLVKMFTGSHVLEADFWPVV